MNQGQLPPLVTYEARCDMCGAGPVECGRFRVEQSKTVEHQSVSRTISLCITCRAPLVVILKAVDQKKDRGPLEFADISELVETPALRAQRLGTKPEKRVAAKKRGSIRSIPPAVKVPQRGSGEL